MPSAAKAAATCIITYLLKADEVCGKDARFLFEPEHSEGHPKVVPKCWDKKAAMERKDAKRASAGLNAEANRRGAAEHHRRAREAAAGKAGVPAPAAAPAPGGKRRRAASAAGAAGGAAPKPAPQAGGGRALARRPEAARGRGRGAAAAAA
eukprot:gene10545-22987_t